MPRSPWWLFPSTRSATHFGPSPSLELSPSSRATRPRTRSWRTSAPRAARPSSPEARSSWSSTPETQRTSPSSFAPLSPRRGEVRGKSFRRFSVGDDGTDGLPEHDSLDVAPSHELEDAYGELVVSTQRHCGRIHDADPIREETVERHLGIHRRVGEADGVPVVDPLDLRRLEEGVGVNLHGAKRRSGVGREVRVAGPAGEDDDPTLLEVAYRPPADVRLRDLSDLDGRLNPG